MTPQAQIAGPPKVTGITITSSRYEALVGHEGIEIRGIGPKGGRPTMLRLSIAEADELLDLVDAGRKALRGMTGEHRE